MSLKDALEYIDSEKNLGYYTEGTIDVEKAERACEIAIDGLDIDKIFQTIISLYVPDGNPELFLNRIEEYKDNLLNSKV